MEFDETVALQDGVITRAQARESGYTEEMIRHRLKTGRWRHLHRGVYATYNGPLNRRSVIWAAALAAGQNAVASHYTAAELWGLSFNRQHAVHVAIPNNRRAPSLSGVVVHRSDRMVAAAHPTMLPRRTQVEETMLDLTDWAPQPDDVVALLSSACGQRLTTADRLHAASLVRPKLKWREVIDAALSDVAEGVHSPLERHYYRRVERAHGLPAGHRQAGVDLDGGRIYQDVYYTAYRTVVELDGRSVHPVEQRSRHLRRDNAAALRGDVVLHFGWIDVTDNACTTAFRVAAALRNGGWRGSMIQCGSRCGI